MSCFNSARTLGLLVAAGTSALFAIPATAQDSGEEIVVMGRFGTVPDSTRSLSQPVSYADLDLSTQAGRAELRRRVSLTSRYLCEKLGEADSSGPVLPSCRESATRDAMARIGTIEQNFAPRGTTWVAPPAWAPPYPDEWVRRYP
jgi:UrcA family protein